MTVQYQDNSKIPHKGDGVKTGSTDPDLVTRGQEILRGSKNARDVVEDRWKKSNDLYDAKFSREEREFSEMLGVPRLFIPKTYAQVQRILEDVLETFFFDFEEIASIVSWKSVPSETRDIVKALLNYRLNGHPIGFYQEVYEGVLNALKNKVGIFKVYPKIKYKKNGKDAIDETGTEGGDPKTIRDVIEQFVPVVETCKNEDVFFSRKATWKDYWKYPIIHRVERTISDCKRRGYKNLDELNASGGQRSELQQQRDADQGSPFDVQDSVKELQSVWIWEVWDFKPGPNGYLISGSYILGGTLEQPAIECRGWVENELPYEFDPCEPTRSPFIVGSVFPEAHVMYGKDFPQVTEGLQKETNAQRNQEREAVARALRAPVLVNKNAGVDLMALMRRSIGQIVQAQNTGPEAVRELQSNNPIPLTAPSQARTDNDYAEISSITPAQLGAPRGSDQTATAFQGLDRNANKKIQMVVRNFAITALLPVLRYVLRLEQEYESDEFIELVTGRKLGWHFKKDEKGNYSGASPSSVIQGDFEFEVNLGVNKSTQLTAYKTMTEIGNQSNAALGQLVQGGIAKPEEVKFFNPAWAFEKMAKLLGNKDVEEMQLSAQPPPPEANPKGTASQPKVGGPMSDAQASILG